MADERDWSKYLPSADWSDTKQGLTDLETTKAISWGAYKGQFKRKYEDILPIQTTDDGIEFYPSFIFNGETYSDDTPTSQLLLHLGFTSEELRSIFHDVWENSGVGRIALTWKPTPSFFESDFNYYIGKLKESFNLISYIEITSSHQAYNETVSADLIYCPTNISGTLVSENEVTPPVTVDCPTGITSVLKTTIVTCPTNITINLVAGAGGGNPPIPNKARSFVELYQKMNPSNKLTPLETDYIGSTRYIPKNMDNLFSTQVVKFYNDLDEDITSSVDDYMQLVFKAILYSGNSDGITTISTEILSETPLSNIDDGSGNLSQDYVELETRERYTINLDEVLYSDFSDEESFYSLDLTGIGDRGYKKVTLGSFWLIRDELYYDYAIQNNELFVYDSNNIHGLNDVLGLRVDGFRKLLRNEFSYNIGRFLQIDVTQKTGGLFGFIVKGVQQLFIAITKVFGYVYDALMFIPAFRLHVEVIIWILQKVNSESYSSASERAKNLGVTLLKTATVIVLAILTAPASGPTIATYIAVGSSVALSPLELYESNEALTYDEKNERKNTRILEKKNKIIEQKIQEEESAKEATLDTEDIDKRWEEDFDPFKIINEDINYSFEIQEEKWH